MPAESALRERIIPALREAGTFIFSITDGMGQKGIPDTGFMHRGVGGFIEFKAHDGVLEDKQQQFLAEMALAGGLGLIVRESSSHIFGPWHATYQFVLPSGYLGITQFNITTPDWLDRICMRAQAGRL